MRFAMPYEDKLLDHEGTINFPLTGFVHTYFIKAMKYHSFYRFTGAVGMLENSMS